jgi:hypothetical protein
MVTLLLGGNGASQRGYARDNRPRHHHLRCSGYTRHREQHRPCDPQPGRIASMILSRITFFSTMPYGYWAAESPTGDPYLRAELRAIARTLKRHRDAVAARQLHKKETPK